MRKRNLLFSLLIATSIITASADNKDGLKTTNDNPCVTFTLNQSNVGTDSETLGFDLADFNGDGILDEIVIDGYDDIEVYLGTASGTFNTTPIWIGADVDDSRWGVTAIDIENDGDMDFVASAMVGGSYNLEVWENDGNASFTLNQLIYTGSGQEVTVADVNNDGLSDIIYPDTYGLNIILNDGDATNGYFEISQDIEPGGGISGIDAKVADFNNDGYLDVILACMNSTSHGRLYMNNGYGQFTESSQILSETDNLGVALGDIDNDGDIDAIFAPRGSQDSPEIWLNNGMGYFTAGDTLFQVTGRMDDIRLIDLNFDGLLDIITNKDYLLNCPDSIGKFDVQGIITTSSSNHIEVADLNNDGLFDIVVSRFSSSIGDEVYFGDASSTTFTDDPDLTICENETAVVYGIVRTEPGTYLQYAGCNSYNRTELILEEVNTNVTVNTNTLSAEATSVNYQWINCSTNQAITGETNQTFTPTESGSYAVVITTDNCSQTSDCYTINLTGINEINEEISIYPNPTNGIVNINTDNNIERVIISDISGKIIKQINPKSNKLYLNLNNQKNGIYIISIITNNTVITKQIIKK